MRYIMVLLILLSGQVSAHQWTPTYPELTPSYVDGIYKVTMTLYNARRDIEWFEISVYDDDWNTVPFATIDKVINVKHLTRKKIDIHIREKDRNRIRYVCSRSKILTDALRGTVVNSRICSKIK